MNKTETIEYLGKRGICFEITDHPAVFTMAESDLGELPYPDCVAKNLFVRDGKKQNFYVISVKGDKRVDLKGFRKRLGLKSLSLASAEELTKVMKLSPGAVTPLGLLNDDDQVVSLYLDREFEGGMIGVHPNDNTATVWMAANQLAELLAERGNKVFFVDLP